MLRGFGEEQILLSGCTGQNLGAEAAEDLNPSSLGDGVTVLPSGSGFVALVTQGNKGSAELGLVQSGAGPGSLHKVTACPKTHVLLKTV